MLPVLAGICKPLYSHVQHGCIFREHLHGGCDLQLRVVNIRHAEAEESTLFRRT